jgi:hypothetical protein
MKRLSVAIAVLAVVALTGQAASASSVHFKKKPKVTFTDNGVTLTATGALSGLGNGDVVVTLDATGQPTAVCTNPAGATQPPGQNPAEVTLTGVEAIPGSEVKNGTVSFNVSTSGPETPVPGAPECPNTQWTETITDVAFSSATITVYQPCTDSTPPIDCTIVLQKTFSL